jgi:hypothetical protein
MTMQKSPLANSNRRFFLRATGISMALPLLESLGGRVFAQNAAVGSLAGKAVSAERPMRMVCIGNLLGFYPPAFFPTKTGSDYALPDSVQALQPHQKDFTLYSGLDHGIKGGHFAMSSFLSGVKTSDAKGMPEGNITVDQRAAETLGGATRFPSLTLGSESGIHGGCLMSWTRSGTRVPPISTPRELFQKLFITEDAKSLAASMDRLDVKGSILDAVNSDAKSLQRHLGQRDKEKLDEYFTSVRDVEKQIELRRKWASVPKPDPKMQEPKNRDFVTGKRRKIWGMVIFLAGKGDSVQGERKGRLGKSYVDVACGGWGECLSSALMNNSKAWYGAKGGSGGGRGYLFCGGSRKGRGSPRHCPSPCAKSGDRFF